MDATIDTRSTPPAGPVPPRRRPFGVLVVALIQLTTVVLALVITLAGWTLPWEGVLMSYLEEHTWARIVFAGAGVAVVVAVIGMWRLEPWGWALMVSLVGLSLVLDMLTWWRTGSETTLATYLRMGLDVVSAFYLNTKAVQDAFRPPRTPERKPIAGTDSAGRVEP
ncbi:MAG: hypothetical protein ABWZ82_07175 [Candidatus Limnocylindrales bacterium]